jgi:molybdopterin molybdotransferase
MGVAPLLRVESLSAARIHTGAMLPAGADAVVMVEDTNQHGDEIEILGAVAPGENVVAVGEDVVAGDEAIPGGRRLRAQDVGGLAALGCTEISVVDRPRVAILSTGDEVVAHGAQPAIGQVRDVNASTIAAVVTAAGGIPVAVGIVGDDLPQLEAVARQALTGADALVLSAGSSVSYRDLTARVGKAIGRPGILVHGIAIKPGKPTLVALAGRGERRVDASPHDAPRCRADSQGQPRASSLDRGRLASFELYELHARLSDLLLQYGRRRERSHRRSHRP